MCACGVGALVVAWSAGSGESSGSVQGLPNLIAPRPLCQVMRALCLALHGWPYLMEPVQRRTRLREGTDNYVSIACLKGSAMSISPASAA